MISLLKKITGLAVLALLLIPLGDVVKADESHHVKTPDFNQRPLPWGSYRDFAYGFYIDYPPGWSITHSKNLGGGKDTFTFHHPKEEVLNLTIAPQGMSDPFVFPEPDSTTEVNLGGRKAIKKMWNIEGERIWIDYHFPSLYPASWNQNNRIQVGAPDLNSLSRVDKMLESFRFF